MASPRRRILRAFKNDETPKQAIVRENTNVSATLNTFLGSESIAL